MMVTMGLVVVSVACVLWHYGCHHNTWLGYACHPAQLTENVFIPPPPPAEHALCGPPSQASDTEYWVLCNLQYLLNVKN